MWICSALRLDDLNGILCRCLGDLTFWVIHVPEQDSVCWTSMNACGFKASIHSMMAPVTFLSDLPPWIDVPHSVGTGRHAVSTADAPVWVDIDYPIRTFDAGIDRTDCHTNGLFTVIAEDGQEEFLGVRILSFLHFFDPRSPHTERNVIFTLASQRTGIAPDALSQVDQNSQTFLLILHYVSLSPPSLLSSGFCVSSWDGSSLSICSA